jgi:hypothetical protein
MGGMQPAANLAKMQVEERNERNVSVVAKVKKETATARMG